MARPLTIRSSAVKVGYSLLPEYIDKIELLANTLQLTKSQLIEHLVDKFTVSPTLPVSICRSCNTRFQSKETRVLCNNCRKA